LESSDIIGILFCELIAVTCSRKDIKCHLTKPFLLPIFRFKYNPLCHYTDIDANDEADPSHFIAAAGVFVHLFGVDG